MGFSYRQSSCGGQVIQSGLGRCLKGRREMLGQRIGDSGSYVESRRVFFQDLFDLGLWGLEYFTKVIKFEIS